MENKNTININGSFITLPGGKVISCVKLYENAGSQKETVLKENRRLSGIYLWVNKLNGNTYVGSGLDLSKRLLSYYNQSELTRNSRPIKDAILKYGHNNFILAIIEYCSKDTLLDQEQYYLDLLRPDYNILKFAYSMLGFKHSPENIAKFKAKIISPEHKVKLSVRHTGKIVDEQTRAKLSTATTYYKSNNPLTPEALANIKAKTTEREGVAVTVLNLETQEVLKFATRTEAGKFLGVTRQAIYNAHQRGKLIKGIYQIS